MAEVHVHTRRIFKRLIVCCDGSWMDSLGSKGGEPQSNVSRLARVVRRTCHDGTHQVISYDAGVGTGTLKLDQLTGGGFGMGLAENVREAYNFLCMNHVDGDDIILVGFSRGAFTARSVADMVATIGLLTPKGLDFFYRIFEDYQNIASPTRLTSEFLCPGGTIEPYGDEKKKGGYSEKQKWADKRRAAYRNWLLSEGYTRTTFADCNTPIRIKALAVWDTVGTLGIPPVSWLGLHGSADQWKFSSTAISDKVEHAFQALALDEPRDAFKPALWEKLPGNTTTHLRQVWFPGNHGGVGGGWHDQQMANLTLAWMCDMLSASCGVEFNIDRMRLTFLDSLRYSAVHPFPFVPSWANSIPVVGGGLGKWLTKTPLAWGLRPSPFSGADPIVDIRDSGDCDPDCKTTKHKALEKIEDGLDKLCAAARPWGLGQMRYPSKVQTLIGHSHRRPGLYVRTDPDTNKPIEESPLVGTSESIHSSVRVRLACGGLEMDDSATWTCAPLTTNNWKLEKGDGLSKEEREKVKGFKAPELGFPDFYKDALYETKEGDGLWRWVVADAKRGSPLVKTLPEEPLVGYWERYLLRLTVGKSDVWRWAQEHPPAKSG